MKNWAKGIAIGLVCGALVACATPAQRKQYATMETREGEMTQLQEQAQNAPRPWFRKVDELWLGSDALKIAPKVQEPAALDSFAVYAPQFPVTLAQVAEFITTRAGIPVQVSPDAAEAAAGLAVDTTAQHLRELAPADGQAQNFQVAQDQPGAFRLQHRGKVRALLDLVTARTGTSWRWNKNTVSIFKYDTRTFSVYTFAGQTTLSNEITSMSAGGQSGGGGQGPSTQANAGQSTKTTTTLDFWSTVKTSVESMISKGGRMAIAPEAGSITVTDVPAVLDRVDTYIEAFNSQVTRQVAMDVRVYALELSDSSTQGIDWDIVYQKTDGIFRAITGGASPVDTNGLGFGVIDPTSRFNGTDVLLSALAKSGKLTIKTSATVATLSNRPVPLQVADQTGYIESVQTTLVPDAGAQTTVTAGSVTTGFSANLLPVVMKNDEVLLQVQITLSSLQNLRRIEFGSEGNALEQPEVSSRQVMQQVRLRSGASLVLTGFEQESLRSDDTGMGSSKFTLAGGSRGTTSGRTVLIVMITPKVIH